MAVDLLPGQISALREKLGIAVEKSPNLSGRLYRSLYGGIDRNPDKWAKTLDLSDQTGVPADTVDRNMPRVRKDAALTDADIDKTVRESPKTTEFLTEDDNAGLVDADDIRNMRYQESIITGSMWPATPQEVTNIIDDPIVAPLIEMWSLADPVFDRLGFLGEVQRNLFSAIVGGLGTAFAGVTSGVEAIGRVIEPGDQPFDPRQSVGRDIARKVALLQEAIAGENPQIDPQSKLEITSSIAGNVVGQFLPFLVPGLGPVLGPVSLVGQGVSEATRRQARSGELGKSTQTDLGLLAAGAASGAINFLPFDFIFRSPVSKIGPGLVRRGTQTTLAAGLEGGSELVDAHSQAFMERFFTANDDALATENPWLLFLIGGLAGAGIDLSFQAGTGGAHGAHKDQRDAMKALAEGASLDILAKGSRDSKLRKTREKSYRSFLQKNVNPETKVYLDGPEMQALLDEKGHAAVQEDAGLSLVADALRKRETATEDVAIGLTDYLTVVAPSKFYKELRSHARTDPAGVSIAAVREREAANIAYVDGLADLAEQDEQAAETLAQVRQVEDMILNQLTATGTLDPQIARSTAKVSAARFARGAAERGITPTEFFRQQGLRTEGPAATRRASTTVSIALGEGQEADDAVQPLLDAGVRVLSQRTVDDGAGLEVEVSEPLTDEQAAMPGVKAQVATPDAEPGATLEQDAAGLTDITQEELLAFNKKGVDEMLALLGQLPSAQETAVAALSGAAKRGWYVQATEALTAVFGPDTPRFAALLASTSPQVGVRENLRTALAVWNAWDADERPLNPDAIKRILRANAVSGPIVTHTPNVVYALTTKDDMLLSGPKVDSFLKNLLGDQNEVTNDTWQAVFNGINQKLFAGKTTDVGGRDVGLKSPSYVAASERVRKAARLLTDVTGELWTPAEVQETVWSWTKALTESRRRISSPQDLVNAIGSLSDAAINDVPDFFTLITEQINGELTAEQRDALENFSPTAGTGLAPEIVAKAKAALDPTGSVARGNADRVGRVKRQRQQDAALTRASFRLTGMLQSSLDVGPYRVARSGNISVGTRAQPLRGATLYEPTDETAKFDREDLSAPPVVEMPQTGTGAQTFRNAVLEARRGSPDVLVLAKDDYAGMRLFLSQNGASGAAVAPTGEIVSVFGDARPAMLLVALQNGGSWISTRDLDYVSKYKTLGFRTAATTEWDADEKPRGWKVTELGKPDTLYMVHVPAQTALRAPRRVPTVDNRDAAVDIVAPVLDNRQAAIDRTLRQDARGDFNPETNVIRLFEGADASTWLHEFGHFMKTIEDASDSPISQDIKAWHSRNAAAVAEEAGVSVEDVRDYLLVGTTGDPVTDEVVDRALQEQFARAWETYLSEGTAPNAGLRDAFRVFSARFREVYPNLPEQLRVNMDDEIRAVFGKLIASAEQIEDMARSDAYRPLFTDATMAGMTEAQFEAYKDRQTKVKDEAAESLQAKLFKRLKRRESKKWKDEKQSIIDELLPEIENNKVNVARRRLKGDLAIDRQDAKRLVGVQRADTKTGEPDVRMPVQLNDMTKTGGEGITAGQAAAVLGYESGAEMLHDIVNAPTAKRLAESRAEAVMQERHGSFNERVDALVASAMQNESHAKVLLAELEALGRQKGESERKQIRQLAKDRVARKSYRELTPALYRNAEIRAAKEAQRALDRGDRDAAAAAKQAQLVNHYLAIEAQAARDRIEQNVDRLGRYRKESTQKAIRASNGGHWEQIQAILARFEFRKSATLKSVEQANLGEWSTRRIDEFGEPLEIDPALLEAGQITHWKDVPLRTLEGVLGTLKNIEHVARRASEVIKGEERVSQDAVMKEVTERLSKLPQKWASKRTNAIDRRKGGIGRGAAQFLAAQTKMPWLVRWMDSGDATGFFHDIFTDPINKAFGRRQDMLLEHVEPVIDIFENFSDGVKTKLSREFYFDELPGADKSFYGETILMMALNTGNKQNLAKLIIGEGWGSRDDPGSLTTDNPFLQRVLETMTKEEWDAVQNIWDRMEALYPALKETYEKASGKTLKRVEAQEVVTPFGTFTGGYFPLARDYSRADDPAAQEQDAQAEGMFQQGRIRQVGITSSATQERNGSAYPLNLSLDVVVNHFEDTIHYIAYHDAVRSVNRILRDPRFKRAFVPVFGEAEFANLRPWLEAVAKQGRQTDDMTGWSRALRHLRMGFTYGVMGFKYSTLISQTLGLSNAAAEVGAGNMLRAFGVIAKDMAHMESSMAFAKANSDIMRNRITTFDRDVGAALARIDQRPGARGKARKAFRQVQSGSLKLIGLVQLYMVDLPAWWGAYIKEMNLSGDEAKAFKYADFAVDAVQGSGRVESMAAVMRNQREEVRIFTQFMTFFSSLWNAQRDLYQGARSGKYGASDIAARMMFMLVLPVILDQFIRGDLLPEEDEDAGDAALRTLAKVATLPLATLPLVRSAGAIVGGFDYSLAPIGNILGDMGQAIAGATKLPTEDEELDEALAEDLFYAGGVLLHIPGTHQLWGTGEHIWNVMEEGEELTFRELALGPKNE